MKALTAAMVLAVLGGTPAVADVWEYGQPECNQLWFMRNLIMDRAGYCFGSALGQALFDNGDCSGKEVSLGPDQTRQVQKIQALEAEIGCKVNTKKRNLDVHGMAALRRLRDMPLPDNGGSACLSWEGGTVPVYDGYSKGSRVIGEIRPGDWVGYGYINVGKWNAVTANRGIGSGSGVFGWIDTDSIDWSTACTDMAG